MKRHLGTIAKLLLVALLMWVVFRQIPFEDNLLRKASATATEVEQVIEIEGSWRQDPLRYHLPGQAEVLELHLGTYEDGSSISISPAFQTYWRDLDPLLFLFGALCYVVTVLIAGARWWWLLRVNGTDVSLPETLRYTWIGTFFNNIMPGAVGGDVIKALYIMKRCPGHRAQVLVSVVVDRVLGLGSLAVLGAVVLLFALDRFANIAIGIWAVILGVGLLGVVALSRRLRQLVRLNSLLNRLPLRLRHMLKLVDQAIFFYRDHGVVITASLIAGVANHIVSVFGVYLLGKSIGVGMPAFEYFALIPVINMLSAIPLLPNGWGFGEWLYGGLFQTFGATYLGGGAAAEAAMHTRGVALSVLYRLHLTAWSLLGGLFVLLEKDKVTRADIEREVEREEQEE